MRGVSKDGRESTAAAILRDASLCDAPQDEVGGYRERGAPLRGDAQPFIFSRPMKSRLPSGTPLWRRMS